MGTAAEALKFSANVGRELPTCPALETRATDIAPDTDVENESIMKGDVEPIIFRISSRPQAPASRSTPSTQARKGAPLFENFIGLKGFSPSPRPFRAWVLGVDGMAGSYNAPGLPNIMGQATAVGNEDGFISPGGNVAAGLVSGAIIKGLQCTHGSAMSSSNYGKGYALGIDASKSNDVYGASSTVMPPSVDIPVILYLGRPR